MIFKSGNIKIEFTDGEKETLRKAQPILEAIEEKMKTIEWAGLGVDNEVYYEQDDMNCAIGILEVLNKDGVEII